MKKPKSFHKNVAGDFYVEDGCCTACLVPLVHAPDLMSFDEAQEHCFVSKQPTSEKEVYQAIKATWAAEVRCIRYAGNNLGILKRLAEAGVRESCDEEHLIRQIKPLLRNHVIFESGKIQSESELAQQARNYLLSNNAEDTRYKVSGITRDRSGNTFSLSWSENNYYSLWFNKIDSKNAWHIFHSPEYKELGSKSVSLQLDEWLKNEEDFINIKWFTSRAWNKSLIEWQATPL